MYERLVFCVKKIYKSVIISIYFSCLFVRFGTAKAKDEQMAVRVCAGKPLTIRSEFAVKHGSMTLTLNLE